MGFYYSAYRSEQCINTYLHKHENKFLPGILDLYRKGRAVRYFIDHITSKNF
jgi:hypothetical protein